MQDSAFPCLLFSNSSSILPRSPGLSSPKCCPSADEVQRPRHTLPPEPFFVRGLFCLYDQDEPKREVQPVRSYPLSPASDQASKFKQERSEGERPYFWPLVGLYEGSDREFHPRCSLQIPSRICSCIIRPSFVAVDCEPIIDVSVCVLQAKTGGVDL